MRVEVVDTNVWVMMDRALGPNTTQAAAECIATCQMWGHQFSRADDTYKLAVDLQYTILREYQKNIRRGGLAERYLNKLRTQPITRLELVDIELDSHGHAILPITIPDPNDRKFVAVALQYTPHAPIVNAADSDWGAVSSVLSTMDVTVIELRQPLLDEKR
jgi:hypothetical protein